MNHPLKVTGKALIGGRDIEKMNRDELLGVVLGLMRTVGLYPLDGFPPDWTTKKR